MGFFRFDASSLGRVFEAATSAPPGVDGDREFAVFQRRALHALRPALLYDAFACSVVALDEAADPSVLSSVLIGLPDEAMDSYAAVQAHDDLSLSCYANPGRLIRYQQVRSHEMWLSHPVFTEHLAKYGIFHAASITYRLTGHYNTLVAFDYLGHLGNPSWESYEFSELEGIALPFVLGWLHRHRRIDRTMLRLWLDALEGLTLTELQNLRKYVSSPHQTLAEQARDLGIAELTLKKSLYTTRNRIAARDTRRHMGYQVEPRGSLRILDAYFRFLELLGDHTRPLSIVRL